MYALSRVWSCHVHTIFTFSSNLSLIQMDCASPSSIKSALQSLPPLSLLINNAGIFSPSSDTIVTATADEMSNVYNVNVIGVAMTTQACLPALQQIVKCGQYPIVINMSTALASISDAGSGYLAYRCSKAALNMYTRSAAQEHKGKCNYILHFVNMCAYVDDPTNSFMYMLRMMMMCRYHLRCNDAGMGFDRHGICSWFSSSSYPTTISLINASCDCQSYTRTIWFIYKL